MTPPLNATISSLAPLATPLVFKLVETNRCCHVCSGLNLFDVYDAAHPDLLDQVKDKEGAHRYVLDMLRTEGILDHLFYNLLVNLIPIFSILSSENR